MRRCLIPLVAATLVGAAVPLSGGTAASAADSGYSGYSATAWAAPVRIEIYEPTIPIPATPQLELELGYSTVEADSGASSGRASWLWPGDPVGEGFKTIVEQFGLPEQLGQDGYPVQVNASQPSGEAAQSDEPFPGTVMRTSARADSTVAQVGFSPDGEIQDGAGSGGGAGDGDDGTPALPGLPGLSGLSGLAGGSGSPDVPGLSQLEEYGAAITGATTSSETSSESDDGDAEGSGLPPELAALVDLEGYVSSSRSDVVDGTVVTTSRSALGDVSLLGGLITLDGVVATSSSRSDGTTGKPSGRATIGGLSIAGQAFRFGPDGFEAAGQHQDIPGLPDQAAAALRQLGVRLVLPKAKRVTKGDQASSTVAGLRVVITTATLRKKLDALPVDALVDAVPSQAGQLKTLLQAAAGLSPKIVVTLGNAATAVDTVQGLEIPTDVPDNDPGSDDAAAAPGGGSPGGGTPSSGGVPATDDSPASGDPASAADDLGGAQLTGSGLPPLYSLPGAMLVGGIALAGVAGTWLRRIGVLTLGGSGSCTHGLDSGLPDLRKA